MSKLMGGYLKYIRRIEEQDRDLISFKCPNCHQLIQTLPTPKGEVWDTICTCPHCEKSFVKITKYTTVETKSL